MSSPDAFARRAAWSHLRQVDDPYVIQPLLYSIANDPDESVRMSAARTLIRFIDEPGVRESLRSAAEADPFPHSPDDCCAWTFAQAAERIAVPAEDLVDWARGKLLDEDLPPSARLLPIARLNSAPVNSVDARPLGLRELGGDAPATVFAIGSSATNPALRSLAWDVLGDDGADPAFAATLLEDLRNHADNDVRASAAMALCWHVALPEVRAALEQVAREAFEQSPDDQSALELAGAASLALFGTSPNSATLNRSPMLPCAPPR
jgi:HEAT repeat protein